MMIYPVILKALSTCIAAICLVVGCANSSRAGDPRDPLLTPVQVNERVYSAIGATRAPTYENWGHNNNLSFVIGTKGVLVFNGGDNYLLARALHAEIRSITDVPVQWLVNENGQGHAFLGNAYWIEQDVEIIAHHDAIEEIREKGAMVLAAMQARTKDRARHTRVVLPTRSSAEIDSIDLGDQVAQLVWFGKAHSPGDISIWLPEDAILIAGDIAFHQRLLGIFPDTDVLEWIASFEKLQTLNPEVVIPGHGAPTDLGEINKYTYGYLKYLVAEVQKILASDGDLADAYAIDQSGYAHLDTFEELAVKNAGRVYQQLELEFF